MKISGGTTQLRIVVKILGFLGGAAANSTPLLSNLCGKSMSKIGVVANTDVLIYDFPATTTLAVGLCTDRAIILLDHGTMKFNESVSSEIRKRCTLLTCNFDEHNIPFISKDALESAIYDSTRISDPTYFRQLFLGKLK